MMTECHLSIYAWILKPILLEKTVNLENVKQIESNKYIKRDGKVRKARRREKGELYSYLPATEILKEKIQGSSPHHRGGHDTEEWHWEDPL
jgi:hypothetical protein